MDEQLFNIVKEWEARGIIINGDGIFNTDAQREWQKYHRMCNTPQFNDDCFKTFTKEELSRAAIIETIKLLPYLLKTTLKKYLVGSYGLKHVVEKKITSQYISNGEVIIAMIYLGYIPSLTDEWNCKFNCRYIETDGNDGKRFPKKNYIPI
jgi:hypothetical protein